MAIIHKKAWPEWFEAVASGKKKYDLRLNEFEIAEGDTLVLDEWDPAIRAYTGRSLEKRVTYVRKFQINDLPWPEDQVKAKGIVVMSLE